ncbi:MAG: YifB family Mg chelatase-like AAA ATPase [Patescibacteria group bacterium]|nr:YifB family Mg chelatase-like AAA ATPase [Patescibacteria group bacterium]
MVSKVFSTALQGLSAQLIEVETVTSKGLRSFNIVGLADKAIEEAKERVSQAIKSIRLSPPYRQAQRVLVNLAPANLKKEGSLYDLPIALSYLLASKQIKFNPEKKIILGELALDGRLKPIKGALSFALMSQQKGFEELILPKENAKEASLVNLSKGQKELKIIGGENLKEVIDFLEERGKIQIPRLNFTDLESKKQDFEVRFSWIKGQSHTKRGLEISAAGGHNVLMQGPPGAGKSILAKAMVSILPKLGLEELLELTQIYSASGLLSEDRPFFNQRPFRSPHHTCSEAALIGGGSPPRPGEITLSHRGVLFLDEFPEFHRDVLESLRNPLEEGKITIQRAKHCLTFPSCFTLIAAANPCPCGYHESPEKECSCTNSQIASYQRKLSGPLMDRIDIFCWVGALKYEDLISPEKESEEDEIREKIERAREIQKTRFENEAVLTNSEMKIPQIKKYCQVNGKSKIVLQKFIDSGKLSARGYHRVLKVARTIADLEGKENISFENINEALSYRLRNEI